MGHGSYERVLPRTFPYVLRAPILLVQALVHALVDENRVDVTQGSSFAVTVNNWDGRWNLWLSDVSARYVQDLHLPSLNPDLPAEYQDLLTNVVSSNDWE